MRLVYGNKTEVIKTEGNRTVLFFLPKIQYADDNNAIQSVTFLCSFGKRILQTNGKTQNIVNPMYNIENNQKIKLKNTNKADGSDNCPGN